MSADPYKQLQALVREGDFQQRTPTRLYAEYALHIAMTLGGAALFLEARPLWLKLVALFVSTCGCLGISTAAHTASHYATSGSKWVNQGLTYLGFPFFFGVSATYWWHKHCVVHHPSPNLIGVDDDIDLSPFFALTEDQYERATGARRLFYRLQWLVIPLALAFNEINIQRSGLRFLLGKLRDPEKRRGAHWLDLGVIALHWATWVLLPMLVFPPLAVLGFYLLRMALMGYAMFIGFAPAHFPAEAVTAEGSERTADFVLRQAATTVNFRTGWFGRLLCGGVEFQIEHHLFPWISPIHYRRLSPVVEGFCREHGYPYRTLGWGEATWKSLVAFYRPKKVLAHLLRVDEQEGTIGLRNQSGRAA